MFMGGGDRCKIRDSYKTHFVLNKRLQEEKSKAEWLSTDSRSISCNRKERLSTENCFVYIEKIYSEKEIV